MYSMTFIIKSRLACKTDTFLQNRTPKRLINLKHR